MLRRSNAAFYTSYLPELFDSFTSRVEELRTDCRRTNGAGTALQRASLHRRTGSGYRSVQLTPAMRWVVIKPFHTPRLSMPDMPPCNESWRSGVAR